MQDLSIIQLERSLPKGSKEVDNVYGVDKAGKIFWRIQSVKDAFGIMQNTPYVSVDIDEIKIFQ